jgi:TIR domain
VEALVSLVFLSYASEDDSTPDQKSGGWVTIIDKALEWELRRLKNVKLWRDQRDLNLPGAIRERLSDVIKDADYLLPVLSHDYNRKQYTVFEVSAFLKALTAKGLEPTDYIIPLMPRPFPEDQFLDELSGLRWVQFFEPSDAASYTPYVEPDGKRSEKFWAAVRQVVRMIEERMKSQRQEQPNTTVYLARTASDQMDNRLSVSNELDSKKCRIAPKSPWPISQPEATSFLSRSLSESQFSIHLLGATPGREQRSGLSGLSALQLDLAAERQKKDAAFRRLIWIPPDMKPMDPEQKKLIDSLDDGSRLTERDELVRGGIEEFKEIIHDELVRSAKQQTASP